ncbi:MAG: hypothetical protein LBJ69_01190 [Holosporales bacterium]|nr:hypothetical protein [Holosporales bacterium]
MKKTIGIVLGTLSTCVVAKEATAAIYHGDQGRGYRQMDDNQRTTRRLIKQFGASHYDNIMNASRLPQSKNRKLLQKVYAANSALGALQPSEAIQDRVIREASDPMLEYLYRLCLERCRDEAVIAMRIPEDFQYFREVVETSLQMTPDVTHAIEDAVNNEQQGYYGVGEDAQLPSDFPASVPPPDLSDVVYEPHGDYGVGEGTRLPSDLPGPVTVGLTAADDAASQGEAREDLTVDGSEAVQLTDQTIRDREEIQRRAEAAGTTIEGCEAAVREWFRSAGRRGGTIPVKRELKTLLETLQNQNPTTADQISQEYLEHERRGAQRLERRSVAAACITIYKYGSNAVRTALAGLHGVVMGRAFRPPPTDPIHYHPNQ